MFVVVVLHDGRAVPRGKATGSGRGPGAPCLKSHSVSGRFRRRRIRNCGRTRLRFRAGWSNFDNKLMSRESGFVITATSWKKDSTCSPEASLCSSKYNLYAESLWTKCWASKHMINDNSRNGYRNFTILKKIQHHLHIFQLSIPIPPKIRKTWLPIICHITPPTPIIPINNAGIQLFVFLQVIIENIQYIPRVNRWKIRKNHPMA